MAKTKSLKRNEGFNWQNDAAILCVPIIFCGRKVPRKLDRRNFSLKALTVGLIRHRPEDHLDFLQSCLDEVKDLPSDRVSWDTFLSKNPQVAPIHSRSPLNGSVTLLDGVTNNNESVQLTKHPLLPQVPSSQDLESEARTDNSEMSRPRKRPRRLERFESPSTSVTTSTNGHDFAGLAFSFGLFS